MELQQVQACSSRSSCTTYWQKREQQRLHLQIDYREERQRCCFDLEISDCFISGQISFTFGCTLCNLLTGVYLLINSGTTTVDNVHKVIL